MNIRRKRYLQQLVHEKKMVRGLGDEDVRYIVNYINRMEKKEREKR